MGIREKAARKEVQIAMARDAFVHLNRIVRQYRVLTRRAP